MKWFKESVAIAGFQIKKKKLRNCSYILSYLQAFRFKKKTEKLQLHIELFTVHTSNFPIKNDRTQFALL